MTHNYVPVATYIAELQSITCDKCNTVIDVDDQLEFQEVLSITRIGGFASVWGDGTKVDVDLCQTCAHEMLMPYARTVDEFA